MKPTDIVAGESYACYFTLKNIPLDRHGRPGGLYSLADLPIERHGDYEGFGLIETRDSQQELFEIRDERTNRTYIVPWADTRDIDRAEVTESS
jgi:hypothetical protein